MMEDAVIIESEPRSAWSEVPGTHPFKQLDLSLLDNEGVLVDSFLDNAFAFDLEAQLPPETTHPFVLKAMGFRIITYYRQILTILVGEDGFCPKTLTITKFGTEHDSTPEGLEARPHAVAIANAAMFRTYLVENEIGPGTPFLGWRAAVQNHIENGNCPAGIVNLLGRYPLAPLSEETNTQTPVFTTLFSGGWDSLNFGIGVGIGLSLSLAGVLMGVAIGDTILDQPSQ